MFEIAEMIYGKPDSGGYSGIVDMMPPRPAEVYETLADIESTMRDLGWFPRYSLRDTINDY